MAATLAGRLPTALALLAALAACRPSAGIRASASSWPEADRLFHQDPRWLGADSADSIALGDGRVLWLFDDTFVATTAAGLRSEATMIHNSVAVQTGSDPSTARAQFHWRGSAQQPASFFAEDGDRWFWPLQGVRLGPTLVVFLARVRADAGDGLGFRADGWRLAVVADASGGPDSWQPRIVAAPNAPAGLVVGAAVAALGEHVVALAQRDPGDHAGFLLRWRAADLAAGRVEAAEWWTRDHGWVPAWGEAGAPSEVMENAGPECSLHFDDRLGRWVHVRSEGFGATTIVASFAKSIEGPWSRPERVFRPPESDRPDAFVYAAKGHPELAGADLVVTYATNTSAGFGKLVADTSLYYPRFVRVTLAPR